MKRSLVLAVVLLESLAFAGDKYPLTMTAIYTEGGITQSTKTTFHDGDYDCIDGDEHNAPICHTASEWARLDAISGTPSTVLFTMADGSQAGVQSVTVAKVPGFIECNIGTHILFCDVYFALLETTLPDYQKKGQLGQTAWMSVEEMKTAASALHQKLFGNGHQMQATFHYKLKGKATKEGFQRIEVEGVKSDLTHLFNPLGDGYMVDSTLPKGAPAP